MKDVYSLDISLEEKESFAERVLELDARDRQTDKDNKEFALKSILLTLLSIGGIATLWITGGDSETVDCIEDIQPD